MHHFVFAINFFLICFQITIIGSHVNGRVKRQMPLCTDGNQAVAQCFSTLTCNGGYRCESSTRLCCRATSMPTCPSGLPASAGCINGGCGQGLLCQTVGTQALCCRVCANNATAAGTCTSASPCTTANYQCNLVVGRTTDTQGLCCPSTSTVSPSTPALSSPSPPPSST